MPYSVELKDRFVEYTDPLMTVSVREDGSLWLNLEDGSVKAIYKDWVGCVHYER